MALLATSEIRKWAGLDESDDGWDDPAVIALESRSIAELEQATGVPLQSAAQTVHLRGGGTVLWLPYPKGPGATLNVSERDSDESFTTLSATEFEEVSDGLRWATRLNRVGGFWPEGADTVRVVYSAAGWTSANVPGDVEEAVLDLIAYNLRNRYRRQRSDANSQGKDSLPESVRRLVRTRSNYYRRRRRSTTLLPT